MFKSLIFGDYTSRQDVARIMVSHEKICYRNKTYNFSVLGTRRHNIWVCRVDCYHIFPNTKLYYKSQRPNPKWNHKSQRPLVKCRTAFGFNRKCNHFQYSIFKYGLNFYSVSSNSTWCFETKTSISSRWLVPVQWMCFNEKSNFLLNW